MAFLSGSTLFTAGQFITHVVQPVQSSGATCTVAAYPANSLPFASVCLNEAGAFLSSSLS